MAEKQIVKRIMDHITGRGGWCVKFHGNPMTRAGTPDLLVCYRGAFLGVEVKQPGEVPTKLQEHTMSKIRQAGGATIVATCVDDVTPWLNAVDAAARPGPDPLEGYRWPV